MNAPKNISSAHKAGYIIKDIRYKMSTQTLSEYAMKTWKGMSSEERTEYLRQKIEIGKWSWSENEWGWIKANPLLHSFYNQKNRENTIKNK